MISCSPMLPSWCGPTGWSRLSGVGGVGKTRLALEVGAEMADEFPDGVWLVELAPVGDPSSVPAAIATALGITPQGDVELIDTVAEAVAGRRLLLLVDNCEHVLDAAGAAIGQILGRSGNAKVLATSREYLWVAGETLLSVSPLALEGGIASDAVKLFVERASAARAGFGLYDTQSAAAVTEICETLDGLPLGIELAAARMATMSAVEVRDRLGDRFRLLRGIGAAAGAPADAATRSGLVLRPVERRRARAAAQRVGLLRRVRPGGASRRSSKTPTRSTCSSGSTRWSASRSWSSTTPPPTRRYGMFETIRQFAEEQLSAAGGLERMRDRHAAHFGARRVSSLGTLERAGMARCRRLGGDRARQPSFGVSLERAAGRVGGRHRCRRARRVDGLLGATLRDGGVGRGAACRRRPPPTSAAFHASTPRQATRASSDGREAAAANAHRATELETDPRYDPCEPGYATFIEALGEVYCGHLDRYVELTGTVAALPRWRRRHTGSRRTSTVSSRPVESTRLSS